MASEQPPSPSSSRGLPFEWFSLLAAFGLMSRIPIEPFCFGKKIDSEHHQRSAVWYPAVGWVLGAILIFCLWLSSLLLPPVICAVLVLVVWVGFSGALHLDGLADTADAWVGGMGNRQRTLDIMKDPTCGPNAVVALVLCLLIKYLLILSVIHSAHFSAVLTVLMVAPLLARCWILPILQFMPYASKGMAADIAKQGSNVSQIISFSISLCVALFLLLFVPQGFWIWLLMNLFALVLFALIRYSATHRINGYTGDILGAAIELNEVLFLLGAAFFLSQ